MIDFELRQWLFSFGPSRVVMIAYHLFLQLWYFLVIGIVLSAAFDVFVPKGNIKWILQKRDSLRTIFIAALLGAISPLGSYSIIPVFVSLLQIGIPLAPVVTFLAASPIVNPFIFFITMETIGLKMALAITFSSVIVGMVTGLLFRHLLRFPSFQNNPETFAHLNLGNRLGSLKKTGTDEYSIAMDAKVEKLAGMMEYKTLGNKWKAFCIQCIKMAKYPGKWFIISIVLAAVIEEYIPSDWIVRFFRGHPYSVLLAAAMAIPLYVCGGGAVPLVWNLMRAGMDQGAALSFFIAGPVTRIAPMITFIALLRYKAFAIYIGVSMALAIILGFLYRYV